MINKLIRWSLNNRALVVVAAALLTVFGIHTATRMPVDVFPDLTAPTVTVITEAHGMSPSEVETQITFPIETAVNGASGVRRVRSATAVGISVVWVEFDWGTDIRNARQIVTEKLSAITGDLPTLRRDVDDEASLVAALRLGVGRFTQDVVLVLGAGA